MRRLWSDITRPLPSHQPAQRPALFSRGSMRQNLPGTIVLTVVLTVVFWVHWRGFAGWPGLINYDEGIYMSQAYAMQFLHTVAPYTFTYDHPFGGWGLIAAYTWITDAFDRAPTAVIAGREVMLLAHMVSSVFLYLLAKRLGIRRLAAGAAVLMFSLSPLALGFQRLVFLDNLAVMWALIAMWAVASPWRSLRSAAFGGFAFTMACLSKETIFMLILGIGLLLWDRRDPRNGKMRAWFFSSSFTLSLASYFLYALVKNELFPGPGHVSLLGTFWWQTVSRTSSGSLLDPSSGTYATASGWLHTDPFLLGAGTMTAMVALLIKPLRGVAVCLITLIVVMFKNGYLPYAYPTAMFPFAALAIAGVLDYAWVMFKAVSNPALYSSRTLRVVYGSGRYSLAGIVMLSLIILFNAWTPGLQTATSAKPITSSQEATAYIVRHLPPSAVIVTNDDSWTDLALQGRRPISEFKADLDPTVRAKFTRGYRSIHYLLLGPGDTPKDLQALNLPTVAEALRHSKVVKTFGTNSPLILTKVTGSVPIPPD